MEYIDDKEFVECLLQNKKIEAIRRYKTVRPCHLREAKAIVDTLTPSGLTEKEGEWLYHIAQDHPVYIAGGFLRDSLLGRPVKDIDVYILLGENAELKRFAHKPTVYKKMTSVTYEGDPSNCIRNVYQCTSAGFDRINIITMGPYVNFSEFIENSFDIGLCKIYYDVGAGTLHTTPEFEKDVRNKTLTVSHYSPENDHLRRILAKYPKYTVVMKHEQQEEAPF